jgi:hypothetical protein
METGILKGMITVIRTEEKRRANLRREDEASLLTKEDGSFAYDQWLFTDAPFVNELCLMLLVSLSHQVERELVSLAARAADDGKEIGGQNYDQEVRKLRKGKGWDWGTMKARLTLKSCEGYTSMEALRHLANSYKHDPSMQPDAELLDVLKLETGVSYLPLPESDSLREGLAVIIGLGKGAAYCDIAEAFVDVASGFLVDVQSRTKLSRVKRDPTSFDPNHAAR